MVRTCLLGAVKGKLLFTTLGPVVFEELAFRSPQPNRATGSSSDNRTILHLVVVILMYKNYCCVRDVGFRL